MQENPQNPNSGVARLRGPLWLIGISLAILAIGTVLRLDERGSRAHAQMNQAGAGGIFAFTGQIAPSQFGVFMVDVDTMTLWYYAIDPNADRLRLMAARTWKFDRYLENHNVAGTTPLQVEAILDEERASRLRQLGKP